MSPKLPIGSQVLAMMPDYGNRSGSMPNVPGRKQPSPATRSGKSPEDLGSRSLAVQPGSEIMVRKGRLVVVERESKRTTSSDV